MVQWQKESRLTEKPSKNFFYKPKLTDFGRSIAARAVPQSLLYTPSLSESLVGLCGP